MNRKTATFIRPFYSSVMIVIPYYDTHVTMLKRNQFRNLFTQLVCMQIGQKIAKIPRQNGLTI